MSTAGPESSPPSTTPASAALAQSRTADASDAERGDVAADAAASSAPSEIIVGRAPDFEISMRALRAAEAGAYERADGQPLYRPLRIFTTSPMASKLDGSIATLNVPYEPLSPGPAGTLLEVIDEGVSDDLLAPVGPRMQLNLDDPYLLIEQGVAPSEGDPRFRAQMAYAVCSITYAAFRRALGRDLAWGFMRGMDSGHPTRLRIRTAYAKEANAYYDSITGELRFGVVVPKAMMKGERVPLGLVHTSLEHDIVVHEMAHALLDGLRAHLLTPTNPDVFAFHEAFADLIAIFQRFTYDDVVRAGIRASHGNVSSSNLFTDLASQFGRALGLGKALRSAVPGQEQQYGNSEEPHERGQVLVAAVFEAFATVFKRKSSLAIRLATNGTGELPPGQLPELLVSELSKTARSLAAQFLSICIRAVDYCPPMDLTFGEYLRAIITADIDLVPDDPWCYREALIGAFQRRGIYPSGERTLSERTLRWRPPEEAIAPCDALTFGKLRFRGDPGRASDSRELERQARAFGRLAVSSANRAQFGLVEPMQNASMQISAPVVESIRSARRVGPDGQIAFDVVGEIVQKKRVHAANGRKSFDLYGGATVLFDASGSVRYIIRKRVDHEIRLGQQADFIERNSLGMWREGPGGRMLSHPQPFRFLHSERLAHQDRRSAE
ncbi:MAG: peptidase M4 [Gemmatimonas sp.]